MQFIGRFYHALEQKGRVSIPASFRSQLGEKAIITAGLEGCLFLFDQGNWQEVVAEAAHLPLTKKNSRDWTRYLAGNAAEVSFDSLGRILIPEHLRQAANLSKNTVIVGSLKRVEIWDQDSYHAYLKDMETRVADIAESLGESE